MTFADDMRQLEPGFQPEQTWCGQWMLDGRAAYLAQVDEWLEARVPVCGDPPELLLRQAAAPSLAKVAAGGFLRVELPRFGLALPDLFAAVREELEKALDRLEGGWTPAAGPPPLAGRLAELLADSGLSWTAKDARFSLPLEEGPNAAAMLMAEELAGAIAFRTSLVRLHPGAPQSICALADFLLELNARLRLARASLLAERAVLEVVLPWRLATPGLVQAVVESLAAGSRVARAECAALRDPEIAQAYLEFHSKGEHP